LSRYAEVTHLDSSERFAILVEGKDGVDTYGVSPQGKEWERWADSLPPKRRNTLEKMLDTLGHHLMIDGPNQLTRAKKLEFQNLVTEDNAEQIDSVTATIVEK
jgi:hypothetical protein